MFRRVETLAAAVVLIALLATMCIPSEAKNASAIRGRVVDAVNHQPLSGARAAVYTMHGTKAQASAFTNVDGNFKLDGLGPGLYRLELSKAGFRGIAIEGIAVRANEVMIIAGSIGMLPGAAAPPNVAQARNACSTLVQPGETADVYTVCGESR